jgi:D-lyxose ketol-isomerase
MITINDYNKAKKQAADMIRAAGIFITDKEADSIEVADFGLNNYAKEGIQILTHFATNRISGKILVLLPNQTEPEHWHPPVDDDPGKEEIIRAVAGNLRFYIPGNGEITAGFIPKGKEAVYTLTNEVILKPGDQLTLPPGTKHWFQAGPEGAVMYSFSTCVRDGFDKFTDPDIVRATKIQY